MTTDLNINTIQKYGAYSTNPINGGEPSIPLI
jgi:hypothetical protein